MLTKPMRMSPQKDMNQERQQFSSVLDVLRYLAQCHRRFDNTPEGRVNRWLDRAAFSVGVIGFAFSVRHFLKVSESDLWLNFLPRTERVSMTFLTAFWRASAFSSSFGAGGPLAPAHFGSDRDGRLRSRGQKSMLGRFLDVAEATNLC
jgi:hypothetical protein